MNARLCRYPGSRRSRGAAARNSPTTNCAFGGPDLKTLFVNAGGTLWSIEVNVPGAPVLAE